MSGIYIASKTVHAPKWVALREAGHPITSTWIDEADVGQTADFRDLWLRCIHESSNCDALIAYREPEDVLKGAFVEVGAALASGKKVFAIGFEALSIRHHPNVVRCRSMESALAWANREVQRNQNM